MYACITLAKLDIRRMYALIAPVSRMQEEERYAAT